MKMLRIVFMFLVGLILIACSKPIPLEKKEYVGEWSAPSMALLITQEGRVVYKRVENKVNKSLDAPLKEFDGNNFIVGVGPLSTKFVVSSAPHQDQGIWKMTVDGVELIKRE